MTDEAMNDEPPREEPKKDLYEELGLSRDASQEDIRAAFRKRAAATHPDQPNGDEAQFKRVNHAHLVLSDPEKRERYDRTGSEDTSDPAARTMAKAMELLATHFDNLFTMAEFHPELHDPLVALKKLVRMERKDLKNKLGEIELRLKKMGKTIKRLRKKGTKKSEAKATKLETVLRQLEKSASATKAKIENRIEVCDKALQMVDDCEYEVDVAEPTAEEKAAADAVAALKKKIAATAAKIKAEEEPEAAPDKDKDKAKKSGFSSDSSADPYYKAAG